MLLLRRLLYVVTAINEVAAGPDLKAFLFFCCYNERGKRGGEAEQLMTFACLLCY